MCQKITPQKKPVIVTERKVELIIEFVELDNGKKPFAEFLATL